MVDQSLIEVVSAELIKPGETIVHRRVATPYNPKDDRPYDGSPTKPWPQCIPEQSTAAKWWQYSAGRARQLGAVPCPEPVCFGGEWS